MLYRVYGPGTVFLRMARVDAGILSSVRLVQPPVSHNAEQTGGSGEDVDACVTAEVAEVTNEKPRLRGVSFGARRRGSAPKSKGQHPGNQQHQRGDEQAPL